MFLKWIYTVFIGILLATFVGVGIQAFYAPPKAPEPNFTMPAAPYPQDASTSAKQLQEERANIKANNDFQTNFQEYNKTVSVLTTAAAIILLVLSVTILQKTALISDGFLFGGVLTQLYSIFRGFTSGDDKMRFVVVSISLVIALALGYSKVLRFEKGK